MIARILPLFLLTCASVAVQPARADDFGPRQDVREVRGAARVVLAHRLRTAGIAPETLAVSDIVVVRNDAVFSWDAGSQHGFSGFVRLGARWWDALEKVGRENCWSADSSYPLTGPLVGAIGDVADSYPDSDQLVEFGFPAEVATAAAQHNADVRRGDAIAQAGRDRGNLAATFCAVEIYSPDSRIPVRSTGGSLAPPFRSTTAGYAISIAYAANDAAPGTKFAPIYARRPTDAEMLPYPTPFNVTSDAVFYFDLMLEGPKSVKFASGSTVEIWVPWVLDAALRYNLSVSSADAPIGPLYGTLFDNVLHFKLPAFAATPGKAVMAEIDGDPH